MACFMLGEYFTSCFPTFQLIFCSLTSDSMSVVWLVSCSVSNLLHAFLLFNEYFVP